MPTALIMPWMRRAVCLVYVLNLALAITETCSAEPPPTEGRIELSTHVEYGVLVQRTHRDNFYSLGIGFEGGYAFRSGPYVGGRLEHFLGDRAAAAYGTTLSQVQAALGYDLRCSRFTVLRPTLAAGLLVLRSPAIDSGLGSSFGLLHVAPGVALINVFGTLLVSVDVRYNAVAGRLYAADALLVAGGVGAAF